jgi:PTH1 family peptidyl-tRNA hydrolase
MNLSGEAVVKFANFYKIEPKDILIIHDDLDLPVGTLRLKYKSSSGGHNGIKSIIKELGTDEIPRLKIGISNDKQMLTRDYVLHKFSKEELEQIDKKMPLIKEIIENFIKYDIIECMSRYNNK